MVLKKKIGQLAYESYCRQNDGVSPITGYPLTKWDELPEGIQSCWEDDGNAAVKQFFESDTVDFHGYDMYAAFIKCQSLCLDISSFDINSVSNVNAMFASIQNNDV